MYNDHGPGFTLRRSVFGRRAPNSIDAVERLIAPLHLGQGNVVRAVSDELLEAFTHAYREVAETEKSL